MNGTAGAIITVMEASPAASLWLPVGISSEVVRRSWTGPVRVVRFVQEVQGGLSHRPGEGAHANDMESTLFHEYL